MNRRVTTTAALWLALALPAAHAAAPAHLLQVTAEGAVHREGPQQLPAGSRFANAVLAAMPRRDAYLPGASVLRVETRAEQVRLRAGLLHDLQTVAEAIEAPAAVAASAHSLHAWVDSLPASGREPIEGNARRLEAGRGDSNRLLAAGDRFYFPERPVTVSVVGAVVRPCALPHVPARDAVAYLADCAVDLSAADPDTLHVIQPDGSVQALGIANWNRSPAQALAPGAIVYVPLRAKAVADIAPELDAAMTRFLATLPLPHDALVTP